MFPVHQADGSLRLALTWKDISNKLLFEQLHSRCHASPCELGWGPKELQTVINMVSSTPEVLKLCTGRFLDPERRRAVIRGLLCLSRWQYYSEEKGEHCGSELLRHDVLHRHH